MEPIDFFGKKLDIDQYLPGLKARTRTHENRNATDEQVGEDESNTTFLRNLFIGFILFAICLGIASIIAASIVGTYKVVQMITSTDNKVYTPFRGINHGIWPGYRHEFFDDRVPYVKAEQVCLSRENASILHFKSQVQEDKFDEYVSLNFWNQVDYPAFQLWTSGFILARQLNSSTPIVWPEKGFKVHFSKIRQCSNRGEGLINAFGTSQQFWQERHIVKDYIPENQPATSVGKTGCWQHIKRNDLTPESFYRFVCVRRIN